ncbi:hypothetical protein MKI28_09490, partial [Streptococcus thermophilus]|uniref:collagen-binding domain-containing protein n=1 Tax=Streptococcus thermophilus TaxID=1308 RepID=UPI00240B7354|nr:hypothetical protein [Streptococcus thermophilus]
MTKSQKNPYLILISSNAVDNIDVYNANFQETFWFTYSNDGSIVDITKFDQAHAAQNNNQIFYFLSASLSSNNGVNSNRREYVQTNDAKTVVISKNPINDPSTGFTAPASTIGLTSVSGSNVPNGLVYTNTDPSGYQSHDGEDSNPDYYALQGGVAFANFTSNKPTLYLGAVPINASSAPWWWHGNHPWWWHGNHNKNSDAVSFISYNVVSNKKVNETIDYKNQSGEMVYDSHTQPVTFITVRAWNGSTSVYYKLGTQSEPTLDSYGKPDNSWSEGNQTTFPPVANPSILGYHVTNTTDPNGDLTQTTAQVVHSNDKDLKVTVTYAPNAEKANVTYIDDTTDNSKKIKSSLVSNHLEEKDNLENVALSSNSVQPATSISDDTYLKNLGIDINGLNINSVLKLASLFHIFANQASLSADTNGNLAVKTLNGSNDFGTRGDSYNLTSGDIYYIQQLAKNLQSNAFRNKTFNHVVLGKDVNVSIENNKVLINDITMNNLKPKDVYQDINGRTYINFSDVFQQLVKASTSYTSTPQTKDVISNYSDMNNRYVDVSKVATGTQIIYVNVPFKYLSAPQPITIKGISQEKNGPTIVINVTDIPNGDQNISTQVQLNYIDGTNALPNSEGHKEPNHVLWNLGTGGQTFNFSSGRFMGSILAPNATINAGVNIDGNIVANIVNITGGESHRWDIHPQPMKPAPTITTEKKTVNETI